MFFCNFHFHIIMGPDAFFTRGITKKCNHIVSVSVIMNGMVKRDTSKVFFPFPFICVIKAFANAKSCNPPVHIKNLSSSSQYIKIHLSGKWIEMVSLWDIIKFFRMILYRMGSENNIVFTGGWIQMMYKAIKGSGNPIREKAACINKDFFLFCAGHRCTFTYFFSQKNMMTDISGCICLFESAVFLEKSIIRMSGISIQLFYQLLRSTYQWEGVIRDIFIHSSASLIVFKIISKKQDPATGNSKIIHDTGVVCNQHITGIENFISVISFRKETDMTVGI